MNRRSFFKSSLEASVAAAAGVSTLTAAADSGPREYYLLRKYHLAGSDQRKLTDAYAKNALIPALNRLGIQPVGAFNVEIGPRSPSLYVLMPSTSVETLATIDLRLLDDSEYRKASAEFADAPAKSPAYTRMESSLMISFQGRPKLTVPPVTANHGARVFELRTYESPTDRDYRRKVEMFHSGEFDIFQRAGFWQVFYGDTLVGQEMPNLTYMIGYADVSDRNARWKAFFNDPEWQKLSHEEKFAFESIVTNVTNYILNPAPYSQI